MSFIHGFVHSLGFFVSEEFGQACGLIVSFCLLLFGLACLVVAVANWRGHEKS